MKFLAVLLAVVSFSAQASGDFDLPFTAQKQYTEMKINWSVS